ncbi:hypothetical protein N4G58_01850 [Edwardsiella piscicida]|nr:hypothetical protein N4G58_01850 [Edwardsiella piscicida]
MNVRLLKDRVGILWNGLHKLKVCRPRLMAVSHKGGAGDQSRYGKSLHFLSLSVVATLFNGIY